MDTKLNIEINSLDDPKAFIQILRLSNTYYTVTISYNGYSAHKKANCIDRSFIRIDADPRNAVFLPKITGAGENMLLVFDNISINAEHIDDFKKGISLAEETMSQIKEIINEYF